MTDIYTLLIISLYIIFTLVFYKYLIEPYTIIYTDILIAMTVISIAIIAVKVKAGTLFKILHRVYIIPVIFLIYTQMQLFIRVINPYFYDYVLIHWDRMIVGCDPTILLSRMANPYLTEYLQLCYFAFFFLPAIHGIECYRHKKFKRLDILLRSVAFSFFFSYLCYLVMPAVGPRFSLHNFLNLENELPGIFFTHYIRGFLNVGSGILANVPNPVYSVNRDCMPSGHTWITLVNIALAFRFKSKYRWFFLVIGLSLIFSTLYLRYHYIVDVIAGIIFTFITLYIEPKIRKYFRNRGFVKA